MRSESRIGLFTMGVYFILSRFFSVPDIILGILLGFSLYCLCLGLLPEKAHEAYKAFQRKLLHLPYSNSNE